MTKKIILGIYKLIRILYNIVAILMER